MPHSVVGPNHVYLQRLDRNFNAMFLLATIAHVLQITVYYPSV